MKFDDTSSDSDTEHVLLQSSNFTKLSKIDAMLRRIREIVILEERPFSFIDLKGFEVDGTRYALKHGVIRNYLSKLTRSGEIEFAYNSGIAFYTLPGKTFTNGVTGNRMGDTHLLLRQLPIKSTPIYKWLKNRRFEKQALHDFRITFQASGIWLLFCMIHPKLVNNDNQDILTSLNFLRIS